MFPRDCRGAKILLIAVALLGLVHSIASAQTGTITGKVTKADGSPLGYANVIIVGTTMGAMTLADGKYTITAVPPGTYTVRAMMMGYKAVEKAGVVVNLGATQAADFKLETTVVAKTQEIVVTAERALVEVTESKTSAAVSEQQLQSMPVDDVLEAVGLKAGIVKTGDDMHVRGGRGGEVQVQIDGVPVSDPLGGGTVDVGMLGTSGSEIVSGGMDAEYGDAQSAVINIATKEGGRRFGGELRYFTDDFGRADKTYTNFDRLSLGFGGPTWWKNLALLRVRRSDLDRRREHHHRAAARAQDHGLPQVQPAPVGVVQHAGQADLQHGPHEARRRGDLLVVALRRFHQQLEHLRLRGKDLGIPVARVRGGAGAGPARNLRVQPHPRVQPRAVGGNQGPGQARASAQHSSRHRAGRSNAQPDGTQQLVTYTKFRAADLRARQHDRPGHLGRGRHRHRRDQSSTTSRGPCSRATSASSASSSRTCTIRMAADSSFVAFNSATRTPETRTENLQLKMGFSHNITSKLLYAIKVSRLDLHTKASVLDENGNQKDPAEFSTAGLPVTLPNGTTLYGRHHDADLVHRRRCALLRHGLRLSALLRAAVDPVADARRPHLRAGQGAPPQDRSAAPLQRSRSTTSACSPRRSAPTPRRALEQQGLNVNIYTNFNTEGAVLRSGQVGVRGHGAERRRALRVVHGRQQRRRS